MRFLLSILFALSALPAFGATYYIDYDAGSDANNGTSTNTPWKHAPGMKAFTASYTHANGDRFIFKGGVSWPAAALALLISKGGTVESRDYYGSGDRSWFIGESWTRPKFDLEGVSLADDSRSGVNFCVIVLTSAADNVIVEDIEVVGQRVGIPPSLAHDYFHGMVVKPGASNVTASGLIFRDWVDAGYPTNVSGRIGGVRASGASGGVLLTNILVSGPILPDAKTSGAGFYGDSVEIANCEVANVTQGMWMGTSDIHGCTIRDGGNHVTAATHENGFWLLNGGKFYNNRVFGLREGVIAYIVPGWSGTQNRTQWFFNNIFFSNSVGQVNFVTDNVAGTNTHFQIFNNVYRGSSTGFLIGGGETNKAHFTFINNLSINTRTDGLSVVNDNYEPTTMLSLDYTNNLEISGAEADAVGMTTANQLKPQIFVSLLVDQGASSSYFDTDYEGNLRPQGEAWDIGAFEFIGEQPPIEAGQPEIWAVFGGPFTRTVGGVVAFTGTNLNETSTVTVGGQAAFALIGNNVVSVTIPESVANTVGAYDIAITTADGTATTNNAVEIVSRKARILTQ